MSADYEMTFQRCLHALHSQRATLDECLARYPQFADELRRDLTLALLLEQLNPPAPQADSQAVARMSQGWRAAAAESAAPLRVLPRPQPAFAAWRRAAAVLAFVLLGTMGAGGGVVAASANALPDEALYGVKRAWESFIVWVATLIGRANDALIHLAITRYDELTRLLALGQATPQALSDFAEALALAEGEADPRLDVLRRDARLGLAQLPPELRNQPGYVLVNRWLIQAEPSPTPAPEQVQATPTAAPASPTPASASPTSDLASVLSQTLTAQAIELGATAQALSLTQTALAQSAASATPSSTPRFAPTATRTPIPPTPTPLPQGEASSTPSATPSPTWTPLALPTLDTRSSSPTPNALPPVVLSPTPASGDQESPFIRLTIQAAQMTQTAQAASTEESSAP